MKVRGNPEQRLFYGTLCSVEQANQLAGPVGFALHALT